MKKQKRGKNIMQALSFSPKSLVIFFIFGITALSVFLVPQFMNERNATAKDNQQEIRILAVTAKPVVPQQSYTRVRTYLGQVEARRTSQLGFEIGGMLKNIHVREGEKVEKRELLASLDTERLEAAKREAEAQLQEIEATLKLAQTTLTRTKQAQQLKAVSRQQLDEAQSNLLRQQASLVRVKAQIDRIRVDLRKAKLYAPYSGTLASRMSDEGTVVASGQPVLEIVETGIVEIRIGLDREVSRNLRPGDMLQGKVDETQFSLKIERILPGRERITRVVQIIATPVNTDISLREADLVEVELKKSIQQQGFWLPVDALTENARGIWSCLVVEPLEPEKLVQGATHLLKRKDLEIISLEEERIFVTGNFQHGDLVVMNGIHRVVPGQRVQLANMNLSGKEVAQR